MFEKNNGIVVRAVNYGESDKILTVLTANGCVGASAKGCRKSNAKLKYAGEMFCFGEFCFTETKGKHVVTACEPIEMFFDIRNDIEKLSIATYMANVAERISSDNENAAEILYLLVNCLKLLIYSDKTNREVFLLFLIKVALISGYKPVFGRCCMCGKATADRFSVCNGGSVCAACADQNDYGITEEQCNLLLFLLNQDFNKCVACRYDHIATRDCVVMMLEYLGNKLNFRPKSLDVLLAFI